MNKASGDDTRVDAALEARLNSDVPPETEAMLRSRLAEFKERLKARGEIRDARPGRLSRIRMAAWGGGALAALAAGALAAALFLADTTPTWAEVVERFRSVKAFSATMYMQETIKGPVKMELWAGPGGRARVLMGSQVLFAANGKVTKAFDVKTRAEVKPDNYGEQFVEALASGPEFSLDTIMRTFSGEMKEVSPTVNADESVSEDMAVFDIESAGGPQWVRVWALKSTRLPIRVQVWSPWGGSDNMDLLFAYSKAQPDVFFDAGAFAAKLKDQDLPERNLAYLFLDEPTGKDVALKPLDESSLFNVVTRTIDGKPWSLSQHRGKAALLVFWADSMDDYQLKWLQKTWEKYGKRDDFAMIGVALSAKAETALAYCKEKGIEWPQLFEPGKEYNNSLARPLGVRTYPMETWLVWKDGTVKALGNEEREVDAAIFGLTFDTEDSVSRIIADDFWKKKNVDEARVRLMFGEPDLVEKEGDKEIWRYRRPDRGNTETTNGHVAFDPSGKAVALGFGGRIILHPTTLTVTISEDYWNRNIRDAIAKYVADRERYSVELAAASEGNQRTSVAWDIAPGKAVSAQVRPATRDVYLSVLDRKAWKVVWEKLLVTGVEMGKDEKKTLTVE